jgi:hypothetical protein
MNKSVLDVMSDVRLSSVHFIIDFSFFILLILCMVHLVGFSALLKRLPNTGNSFHSSQLYTSWIDVENLHKSKILSKDPSSSSDPQT